ncbi:hypothetical protein tinsulaeT_09260 [Thalassotalea insulae]|uniref:T2SS protein K first SAM-like domain-containing protein n=2 Tax=Thalassotalea insulae TaxID=2056778 RepID=A0ABQ6GTU2_9GAMM|nr:hypothetical protein tinsulaeT_09260 [Thalassotalea insulae]
MVLFIAAMLVSISVLLIAKTKQHVERISIAKEFLQAERQIISDISYFIYITQTSPYAILGDSNLIDYDRSTLPKGINLQGVPFSFRSSVFTVQDMGGLISINPLERDRLMKYLSESGWPSEQVFSFVDVLEDWQDNDDFQRINGAEKRSYGVVGYPLNQSIQDVKELGLLENVEPTLLTKLANDSNLITYGAGRQSLGSVPDKLLPTFFDEFEAKKIQTIRNKQRQEETKVFTNDYTSGNWIIKVSTSNKQARSSKLFHLFRRFGEARPFVISNWRELAK